MTEKEENEREEICAKSRLRLKVLDKLLHRTQDQAKSLSSEFALFFFSFAHVYKGL